MTASPSPSGSPTYRRVERGHDALSRTLDRNISTLVERTRRDAAADSLADRISDRITGFAGSMSFVVLHLLLFGGWILINTGVLPVVAPFDPSLVVLAMIASVEAIFLSTFVLISQNRMAAADDKRADLNLQISLLHEHETTRLIALVLELAHRLDVEIDIDPDIEELKREVRPEKVMDHIEKRKGEDG